MLLEVNWEGFFLQPARVMGLGVMALIFVGVALRKNRKVHPPLMVTCFILDLALVLYLEFTRGAIGEAAGRAMEPTMFVHVVLATLSMVLYGLLLYSGPKVLRGDEGRIRTLHRRFAITFLINRVAVLVTAVMVST